MAFYYSTKVKGREEILRLLLQDYTDVNTQDYKGLTALYYVVFRAAERNALVLLENSINMNTRDYEGQIALYYITRFIKSEKITALLLDRNAEFLLEIMKSRRRYIPQQDKEIV
jgi:ankyrin repeat protein